MSSTHAIPPLLGRVTLRRGEVLSRLDRAFEQLPVQIRPRFKRWAHETYDRFYADIVETTMALRRRDDGAMVAQRDPSKPVLRSWDEYIANLMRAARNSSHGLQDMLRAPDPAKPDKPASRLLLATNSGDVPYSLYEVTAIVFFGLVADAERLCHKTWW